MQIEMKPIKSNAQVKGYIAEVIPGTPLEVAVPVAGLDSVNEACQEALSDTLSEVVDKLNGAAEAGALPSEVVESILGGFTQAINNFDLHSVGHYTAAGKAVIASKLEEAGAGITDPWGHFVKGKAPAASKPAGLSFDLD